MDLVLKHVEKHQLVDVTFVDSFSQELMNIYHVSPDNTKVIKTKPLPRSHVAG
jgi:hypothetical protein